MDYGALLFCAAVLNAQTLACASGSTFRRLNEKLVLLESRLNFENEQRHQDYENLMSKLDEITTKLDTSRTENTKDSDTVNKQYKVGVEGDAKSHFYRNDQMQYLVKGLVEEKRVNAMTRRKLPNIERKLDEMNHRIKRELDKLDSDIKATYERGEVLGHTIEDCKIHNDEQHQIISNAIGVMAKTQNDNWTKMKLEITNTNAALINAALKEHFERLNHTLEHVVKSSELEDTINKKCKIDDIRNFTETSIEQLWLNMSHSIETEINQLIPITSCKDGYNKGYHISREYKIYNHGIEYEVYCDQDTDGGGWTVFQRRQNGAVDFYRNSLSYKHGFGDLAGEFWLGNEYLSAILRYGKHELRIDMEDFEENRAYAKYSSFSIDPKADNYKLHVGGYTGDAGDALAYHNGQRFSTKDLDVDEYSSIHCSEYWKGAWWYKSCHHSNLNGMYNVSSGKGIIWSKWKGGSYSLKFVEMKFREI